MKIDFDPDSEKYLDKVHARIEKTQIVEVFTPPRDGDVIIMGTFSRTWRNEKRREVMRGKGVECNGFIDTPTAHTRDYISFCYDRRPARRDQRELLRKKKMPLFSYPCIIKDAIYLDIKAAWYSIVSLVGWDCEYMPGRWLSRGSGPTDFQLANHKVARSAMVTIGRTTPLPLWKDGRMTYQRMYNATENFHIWGVIADTLNAIAHVAVNLGARYVNTDGFIISRSKAYPLMQYIESWGLTARVKYSGTALICGPGAYTVGDHASMRSMNFIRLDNIDREVDASFLLPRVAKRANVN